MKNTRKSMKRREFLRVSGAAVVGGGLAGILMSGCAPRAAKKPKVILGTTGYAVNDYRKALDALGFTRQTGIEVEIQNRPTAADEITTQLTSAIQAGTSPYDVLDFEDEIAVPFARAGWLLPLDELIAQDVWDDFTPHLLEMTKVWDQYKGETFRVHHNFEACYWWYRKDWFEEKQIPVPTTWQEVSALGKVFTDKETGVWASAEGMIKRAYLNVYIAWITRQAGGNPYDVDDSLRVALEYIDDLIHKYSVLNAACLQKNYDQQNSDYIADRVAFMRQWPFFYDVTRQHESWYSEEKVACGFPPVGPGGKSNSTYAAGWGFGIPKTAENVQPSKELIRFLIATENAEKMVEFSTWFLNARRSILASAGDKGLAKYLRMYTDAGIIATRPFHPSYTEVLAVLEDSVSAFLTNQIGLEECLKRSREGIARA